MAVAACPSPDHGNRFIAICCCTWYETSLEGVPSKVIKAGEAGEADLAVADGLGVGDVLFARKASSGTEATDEGL